MSSNSHHQPLISLIIPVHRNEARAIRAIQSAKWADEIIIIDHQSGIDFSSLKLGDATSIIPFPKINSFAQMRNMAMKKALNPWVFFLDSDEWVTSQLAQEIRSVVTNPQSLAYSIKRTDLFYGQQVTHGEVGNAWIIRLVRKDSGEWSGAVHEVFQLEHTDHYGQLHETLLHEPHTSIHEFIQKINFYTSLIATSHTEAALVIKSIVLPIGKFLFTFVVRGGFLDGYRGLIYSFVMSLHSSAVRIKRYESL